VRSPRHAHSPYNGRRAFDVFTTNQGSATSHRLLAVPAQAPNGNLGAQTSWAKYERQSSSAAGRGTVPGKQEATTKLRTDRTYRYPFTVIELWDRLQRIDAYTTWWPWLREFDGRSLAAGQVWTCSVQPPLPYAVRFTVAFDDVADGEQIVTTIAGDIGGTATLQLLAGGDDSSRLRLTAVLAPQKRSMLAMSFVARPLVTFGHHWILDTGARQFAEGLGGESLG
jgi:hypothetical protein